MEVKPQTFMKIISFRGKQRVQVSKNKKICNLSNSGGIPIMTHTKLHVLLWNYRTIKYERKKRFRSL